MSVIKKFLNILQIPIKIALIGLFVILVYNHLNRVFITEDVDYGQSFHSLPEDSMDILVLGSSHAQYSFVPSFIHQDLGLYSYVLGTPCQPLEVAYEMLKEGLKTQSPKLVILEVYTAMPLRKVCEADVCYVSAEYQMTGEEKIQTISYLPKEKAIDYYNDFLSNHNNWKKVSSLDELYKINEVFTKEDKHISSSFGYVEQIPSYPISNSWYGNTYDGIELANLDSLDLESLNNIYDLCNENGIELLLYKTPLDGMDEENQAYLNAVWDWASDHGVEYLDFFRIGKELDYNMCFHSDSYHANINGANIITSYISDFIDEHYEFNHQNNDLLEDIYSKSSFDLILSAARNEYDPLRYLKRFNYPNTTILINYHHTNKRINQALNEELIKLGIENGLDSYRDLYAIIYNGKLLISSSSNIEYELNGQIIKIDKSHIQIGEESYEANGDLTLLVTNQDFSKSLTKHIKLTNHPWEMGYDGYIQSE